MDRFCCGVEVEVGYKCSISLFSELLVLHLQNGGVLSVERKELCVSEIISCFLCSLWCFVL